jgi:hypothetical protein
MISGRVDPSKRCVKWTGAIEWHIAWMHGLPLYRALRLVH